MKERIRRRRTKIVCTIGPASEAPEVLRALIEAGMDVARLNLSHDVHAKHAERIALIRELSAELKRPVAILGDLQGPKLRVGEMEDEEEGVELQEGEEVLLTARPIKGHKGEIPVRLERLNEAVEPGDRVLIDDGLIELRVKEIVGEDVLCTVVVGGRLLSYKGINLPHAPRSIPSLTEKDRKDLRFLLEQRVDWIALSFVRNAQDVLDLRKEIHSVYGLQRPVPIVAKIEKPEALDAIEEIIEVADAVMVARGDLGVEAGPEVVPWQQKRIIGLCNAAGKPVITATQMLDSMIHNPRPTRAEASDVANAIMDGTDAVMLSGETSIGRYPVETLQTMVRIVEEVEAHAPARISCPLLERRVVSEKMTITEAVAHAVRETAHDLGAAAIITPTFSGRTARLMSKYRPLCPIIATTPNPSVQRQLMLYWGVTPLRARWAETTDEILVRAVEEVRKAGLVQEGDLVVITAGAAGTGPGVTDLMKVQYIEPVLLRGEGLGDQVVEGIVRLFPEDPEALAQMEWGRGDILVLRRVERDHLPFLRHAAGVIVEEGGEDSLSALLTFELGAPALIGVQGAREKLREGQPITLDPRKGEVRARRL